MEQAECFRTLRAYINDTGRMTEQISHRAREEERVGGVRRTVWRNKIISVEAVKDIMNKISSCL